MSRPRRYGPARSLRLPLEEDQLLVATAESADKPVGAWMRDIIRGHLPLKAVRPLQAAVPSEPPVDVARLAAGEEAEQRADELAESRAVTCEHDWAPPSTALGGQRRCRKCKAVKR